MLKSRVDTNVPGCECIANGEICVHVMIFILRFEILDFHMPAFSSSDDLSK